MQSSATIEWKRPIVFDQGFLASIEGVIQEFQRAARLDVLLANDLNPADFTDTDALRTLAAERRDYKFETLADTLDKVSSHAWKVYLSGSVILHDLQAADIAKLANAGDHTIERVETSVGSRSYSLDIDCSNSTHRPGVSVSLRGPLDIVDSTRRDLTSRLQSSEKSWWPLRNTWVLWALWVLFASIVTYAANVLLAIPEQQSATVVFQFLSAFMMLLMFVGVISSIWISKAWAWAFPMVDFRFGGGAHRASLKSTVRKALWTVPIFAVLMPIITNILSDRIG